MRTEGKRRGKSKIEGNRRNKRNRFSGFVVFVDLRTHIILWVIKAITSHLREAAVEVIICGTEKCKELEGITQEKYVAIECWLNEI